MMRDGTLQSLGIKRIEERKIMCTPATSQLLDDELLTIRSCPPGSCRRQAWECHHLQNPTRHRRHQQSCRPGDGRSRVHHRRRLRQHWQYRQQSRRRLVQAACSEQALLRHVSELIAVAALYLLRVGTVFGVVALLMAVEARAVTITSSLGAVLAEVASLGIRLVALVTRYTKTRKLTFSTLMTLHVVTGTTRLGTYGKY
ncbi:hypothetical protein GGS26DRAFT_361411 [Hypomontagnella submonticulosa]|nr:hypothetical protein GGS26DRAFT_361411 [Hypomontagnella submonticulosa]